MSVEKLWGARSLEDARGYAAEADPRHLCDTITGLTDAHEATFERSLDLVGSHALMSPRARAMLGTGLIDKMRQTGLPGNRVHAGAHWIDRIETIAVGLAKRLFGVAYAEVRPLSCALANGLVFAALAKRGDTVLAQTRVYGADPSTGPDAFGDLFGLEYADLPYDETQLTVDVERAVEAIRRIKPRLVVFGSGFILFPYPVEELKKAAKSVGATVFYDGAHAVGLTGGGQYQDPIAEGADVVTGSVPKTMCGPTGGIILTNDPEDRRSGSRHHRTHRLQLSQYSSGGTGDNLGGDAGIRKRLRQGRYRQRPDIGPGAGRARFDRSWGKIAALPSRTCSS